MAIVIFVCLIIILIGVHYKKFGVSVGLCLLFVGAYILYDDYNYGVELNRGVEVELVTSHIVEIPDTPFPNEFTISTDKPSKKENKTKVKTKKVYKDVLKISDLDLIVPILPDISRESLRKGAGHYPDTKELGEKGNCVLAGHSSLIYSCIFDKLHDIKLGTKIVVYDKNSNVHNYFVTDIMDSVEPTDVSVLESKDMSKSYLTLLTCTDYGKKRFVVVAKMEEEDER